MTITRGVRNNNPGNIDFNARNKWQGQIGIEPGPKGRFAVFDKPENGIRALAKLLLNYRGKDGMPGVGKPGIDTPLEFINRWAPSVENNTSAYANAVAKALGVKPTDSIDISRKVTLVTLVVAIIAHENANFAYPAQVVLAGVESALA